MKRHGVTNDVLIISCMYGFGGCDNVEGVCMCVWSMFVCIKMWLNDAFLIQYW